MKIATVLVDRANYGRLKPLMRALAEHHEMSVICAGSMVLDRFKRPADDVEADGFKVVERLHTSVEGATLATGVRSIAAAVTEFSGALDRNPSDYVLIIGDRQEALGAAIAAAYLHRSIIHVQGGEVSGSLDESARHAITKLSHWHVPATEAARRRIVQMGESPDTILAVGCPSSDLAKGIPLEPSGRIMCQYHPDTHYPERAAWEVERIFESLRAGGVDWFWPNIDAGSGAVHKSLRRLRDRHRRNWTYHTNLPPEDYYRMLAGASLAVGNSSSFVRDSGYWGTPVVLVGSRQDGRECGANVLRVDCVPENIRMANAYQFGKRHDPSTLYGDGNVCQRIVDRLAEVRPYHVKRFCDGHSGGDPGAQREQGDTGQEHAGDLRAVAD